MQSILKLGINVLKNGAKSAFSKRNAGNLVRVPNEQINQEMISAIFSKAHRVSDEEVAKLLSQPTVDISILGEIKAYAKPIRNWLNRKLIKPFKYLKRRGFKSGVRTEGPTTLPARDLPPDVYNKIYIESEEAKQMMQETEKIYAYRYC